MISHSHPSSTVDTNPARRVIAGAVSGLIIVRFRVDSFIATLGMSSILLAGTYFVTDGKQITEGFTDGFLDMGRQSRGHAAGDVLDQRGVRDDQSFACLVVPGRLVATPEIPELDCLDVGLQSGRSSLKPADGYARTHA